MHILQDTLQLREFAITNKVLLALCTIHLPYHRQRQGKLHNQIYRRLPFQNPLHSVILGEYFTNIRKSKLITLNHFLIKRFHDIILSIISSLDFQQFKLNKQESPLHFHWIAYIEDVIGGHQTHDDLGNVFRHYQMHVLHYSCNNFPFSTMDFVLLSVFVGYVEIIEVFPHVLCHDHEEGMTHVI